jgi:hypothetical protein
MSKEFRLGHSDRFLHFSEEAIAKLSTADEFVDARFVKGNHFDADGFLDAQKDFEKFDFEATATADATFELLGKSVFGEDFATVTPAPKAKGSDRFQSTTAFRKRLHGALPEDAPAWLNAFLGGNESQARLAIRRQLKTDLGL